MDCKIETCPAYLKAKKNEEDIKEIKEMRLETRLTKIETSLEQLLINVGKLIDQPSKRWEMVIGAMIVGAVSILAEVIMK